MRFGSVGDVMVIVHTSDAPDDLEWHAMLRGLAALDRVRGVFVMTDGGMPSAAQRTALGATFKRPYKAAVLSRSKVAQLVGKAISWFGISIRVYQVGEHREALRFLEVPHSDHEPILQKAAELRVLLAGLESFDEWRERSSLDYESALQRALIEPLTRLRMSRQSRL
jgi:hypothetical protein